MNSERCMMLSLCDERTLNMSNRRDATESMYNKLHGSLICIGANNPEKFDIVGTHFGANYIFLLRLCSHVLQQLLSMNSWMSKCGYHCHCKLHNIL